MRNIFCIRNYQTPSIFSYLIQDVQFEKMSKPIAEKLTFHYQTPERKTNLYSPKHIQKENIMQQNSNACTIHPSRSRSPTSFRAQTSPALIEKKVKQNQTPQSSCTIKFKKTPEKVHKFSEKNPSSKKLMTLSSMNPEAELLSQAQILKALLERERKEKAYWKNYGIKLQEQNKVLRAVQKDKEERRQSMDTIKKERPIQKLVNEKLGLEKEMNKVLSENRELKWKIRQLEGHEKNSKLELKADTRNRYCYRSPQNRPLVEKIRFHIGNLHDRKEIEDLRKVIWNQEENIAKITQELMMTKAKVLAQKY